LPAHLIDVGAEPLEPEHARSKTCQLARGWSPTWSSGCWHARIVARLLSFTDLHERAGDAFGSLDRFGTLR
jgi:hypothetical protein